MEQVILSLFLYFIYVHSTFDLRDVLELPGVDGVITTLMSSLSSDDKLNVYVILKKYEQIEVKFNDLITVKNDKIMDKWTV